MGRLAPALTKSQVGRIRANLSRQATQIGVRLSKHALGALIDNDGNKVEMSNTQIKAAEVILRHTLPAMSSTEYQDITDKPMTRGELIQQANEIKQQIIDNLTPEEIAGKLKSIEPESSDMVPIDNRP